MRGAAFAFAAVVACGASAAPVTPSNTAGPPPTTTAVLLVATAVMAGATLRFQPLACTIAGRFETGARCGEAMPARAAIETWRGRFDADRTTRPFHDAAGNHDYAAPYAPACCMDNTCVGRTIPYTTAATLGAISPADLPILVGVWPAGANLGLRLEDGGAIDLPGRPPGPHSRRLVASTDIDHDGRRERVVYELWANDDGVEFVDDAGSDLYGYSCGNI